MVKGTVKWYDPKKGYGFITQDNGQDVFVHWRQIQGEESFKTLQDGQRVEFRAVQGEKGPQAEKVTVISDDDTKGEDAQKLGEQGEQFVGLGIFGEKIRLVSLGEDGEYRFLDEAQKLHSILYIAAAEALALKSAVEELETLVNDVNADERAFQDFFERHPRFILNDEYKKAHPHVALMRDEGPLIPDFLLEPVGVNPLCDILDLKLPSARLFVLKKSRMRFSTAVFEACAQLREYHTYFDDPGNRDMILREFGLRAYKPKMVVVIGRRGDIDPIVIRQMETDLPHLTLRTYDDVLARARARLQGLK